jgi:hypothetical protein
VSQAAIYDVFISYAHADNDWPRYGARGWVDCFGEALESCLKRAHGKETTIWRDAEGRISGASVLTPTIKEALEHTRVLVILLSPAYLKSEWCSDELRFFRDAAKTSGGLRAGTKTRVVKVLKLPVEREKFHTGVAEIDDVPGHDFFQKKPNGTSAHPPQELDPPYGDSIGKEFSGAINALASDIAAILTSRSGAATPAKTGATIYLAETTSDTEIANARDRIRRELEQFDHEVLPADQRFPGPDYGERVRADLARASLSIHLVGESYGMVPERSKESIVEMQYRLAGEEAARRPEFKRLVWMPPRTIAAEERQAEFIETLQDVAQTTTLEEFKTQIQNALKPPPPPEQNEGGMKSVYLLFDDLDKVEAMEVQKWLFARGFTVWRRLADGQSRAIGFEKEKLKASNGLLIYHGQAPERWLDSNLVQLNKVFAANRSHARPPCGAYFADPGPPERPDKNPQNIAVQFVQHVIPGFGGFQPNLLEAFIKDVRSSETTLA